MPGAVEIDRLRRVYVTPARWRRPRRETVALDDVSLSIPPGETHGLLGPNGAGKTTLVKVLSTILLPSAGTVTVAGHDAVRDVLAVRRSVGLVLGGERGLYTRVSGRRNLRFWATAYGLDGPAAGRRVDELLERLGLREHADAPVETYSRGMRQRLHLARGLVADPAVLFLDEPTTGMDPAAAHDLRSLVRSLQREGRTFLLTTHDMAEAEALCHRVTLIDRGRLLVTDEPGAIGRILPHHVRVEFTDPRPHLATAAGTLPGVTGVVALDAPGTWQVRTASPGASADVLRWLVGQGVTVLRTTQPSLEEAYLELLGHRGLDV